MREKRKEKKRKEREKNQNGERETKTKQKINSKNRFFFLNHTKSDENRAVCGFLFFVFEIQKN